MKRVEFKSLLAAMIGMSGLPFNMFAMMKSDPKERNYPTMVTSSAAEIAEWNKQVRTKKFIRKSDRAVKKGGMIKGVLK